MHIAQVFSEFLAEEIKIESKLVLLFCIDILEIIIVYSFGTVR